MPSQQYYLELDDPNVCDLDSETSSVTAKELGYTELFLKDRSILSFICGCFLITLQRLALWDR